MRNSKEFRALARARLAGNWGISLLVSLVAALLGSGGSGAGGSYSNAQELAQTAGEHGGDIGSAAQSLLSNPLVLATILGLGSLAFIFTLVHLFVGSSIELGQARYYIGLIGGERPGFGVLFSRFHIFLKAVGLRLYMGLFIFLWGLLFIIPGIIAAYRYAMAPYLMAQYPEKGIRECVEDSKALMLDHKARLFFLNLSFIGWGFLCLFTLGIGMLWLTPYMQAATAAFYLERTGQLQEPYRQDGWNPPPQA